MTDKITVNEQSSIRIESEAGVIYIDPFRIGGEKNDADYIFVTHDHYDHFSPEDIRKVAKAESVLIVPDKMISKAKELSAVVSVIKTVKPNESYNIKGLEFETIPAYNALKPFHTKGACWVGYIFIVDGKRIYVAGDTDATKEAKSVKCDIALVPIGGTYTMDAKKAAELINSIRPAVAIPTHYGSIVGSATDGKVFSDLVDSAITVETKL